MKLTKKLLAVVATCCLLSTAVPAFADEGDTPPQPTNATPEVSVSPSPSTADPQEPTGTSSGPGAPALPQASGSPQEADPPTGTVLPLEELPSEAPGDSGRVAVTEELPAESPPLTEDIAILPTLTVTSSATGDVLRAGTGNYVFAGTAPAGPVLIQWANNAVAPLRWNPSMEAVAAADGQFRVETPIGPWEADFSWRVVSPDEADSPPSPIVSTVIRPGVTLDVSSTATGSRFYAGYGNYVFGGSAPPGGVTIWWRTAGTSTWKLSIATQASSTGDFRIEVPIGPWPGDIEWRATSTTDQRLAASSVQRSLIQLGVTFDVWSTTTGARFVAGNGNYIFAGTAPHGDVTVWWRTPGTSGWKVSTTTPAWSTGTFRVEVPIGPWPGNVEWQVTSNTHPRMAPSIVRLTVIAPPTPVFTYSVRPATTSDLGVTYRAGCPVGPSKLSVITMNHFGFDGGTQNGELVVRSTDVTRTVATFRAAFDSKFPIRKMVNPRNYKGANDVLMMEDDNTSAFNCRQVVGNPYRTSPHSYGYAFDINPRENPYYAAGVWYPSGGRSYINRSTRRAGMHFSNTVFPSQFVSRGGHWGASYSDYHHFETVPR
ncbi:M15 family metallopeptidase [Tessaracoccus sp.]